MTYKQPAKDFIKRITGDIEYQRSKLKEASLVKLVNDDLRKTRFDWNDDKLFLLLDDGRFWKYGEIENIPNEVIEELKIV